MTYLHVFDMDGTLLLRSTASLEIARALGCGPELAELEAAFATGAVDTRGFAARICALWHALTPDILTEVFRSAPWITGLEKVMSHIRARGERSMVITMSPDFFARELRRFGVDEVVASRFPPLPIRTGLDVRGILSPMDKVRAVDRVRDAHGLERGRCIAYGDSGSDVPLFSVMRNTVAVNGDDRLRRLARLCYEGEDLTVAYGMARECFIPGSTTDVRECS